MNPLVIAAAAYFLSPLAKGSSTAAKLEFFPNNLEIIKGKLQFKMDILNPTKNPLKVDSFFANIFSDKTKIGSIERGVPFTLEPNRRTPVSFPVRLNAAGLVKFSLNISKLKTLTFRVEGIAKALGLDNAVTKDISLNA